MNVMGAPRSTAADLLAIGFGTTVAMWAVGYIGRIPPASLPGAALLVLLLVCMAAGGWFAGRFSERGWKAGLYAGAISAALNLLVLGSVLSGASPDRVVPSALGWIPGSIVLAMLLGAAGAWVGARERAAAVTDWTSVLTRIAAIATFFLLVIGGVVTSERAGLSVVDWPTSYGYNMFLYPLSRMVGGIFYEHAHRLFGSLVGLITLVTAVHLQRTDGRRWLRALAWSAVVLVVVQGILGGLRVTGRFTTSQSPLDVAPNLTLAVVHGVVGQTFFALMVAIAVFTSPSWTRGAAASARAGAERPSVPWGAPAGAAAALVALILLQLVLGAIQRHFRGGLIVHIAMAAVVFVLAHMAGVRAVQAAKRETGAERTGARETGAERSGAILRRSGLTLMTLVSLQVLLGLGAIAALFLASPAASPSPLSVAVRTAHQSVGAALLASAVVLALWCRRGFEPVMAKMPEAVPAAPGA